MEKKKGWSIALIAMTAAAAAMVIATCIVFLGSLGSLKAGAADGLTWDAHADPHTAYGKTITAEELHILSRAQIEKKYRSGAETDTYDDGSDVSYYDKRGNLLMIAYYDADKALLSSNIMAYNVYGDIVEDVYLDADDEVTDVLLYFYDKEGVCLGSRSYSNLRLDTYSVHTLDEQGNTVKEVTYNASGTVCKEMIYDNGLLLRDTTYCTNGKKDYENRYAYDSSGRTVREEFYSGKTLSSYTEYAYDDETGTDAYTEFCYDAQTGCMTYCEYYNEGYVWSESYDEYGYITEECSYNEDGETDDVYYYENAYYPDETIKTVTKTDAFGGKLYTEQYDRDGELVKCTYFEQDKVDYWEEYAQDGTVKTFNAKGKLISTEEM